ncbi:Formamidopyrimidine-DNA glycosylase [Posidoniimonas corsicana]|uniref:Formamidopyrimidine-DNA glycosylase n=1 Tax=Posidoniimonas corsicana TaxID=1938618 RepID=A0A5C5UVA6_9BACT|nr:DNA-formamidopyrimidine glycosylase family protein [Posidoniimonas corsicana]TWT30321.1 Formamidopyrimidine-DNA glycosylase [Posidoniimonas corsicana]
MPELPEVETMRRGIAGIVGGELCAVERLPCPRKPILLSPRVDAFRRRAEGQRAAAVDRIGKRVVVRLASDDAIILEPRMTGLVLTADPPDPLYLRVRFDINGGDHPSFWYWDRRGLGSVRLLSPAEMQQTFGEHKLGPDALALSVDSLRARLGVSKREIKVGLLDQKAVSGIGNLYAAEILHVAGVHPQARCDRLTRKQWTRIVDATHEVLEEAIRHEGSTLSDGTYRNALSQDGGYQNCHRVYDRAGLPCPTCEAPIERIVQAQRSTFFCRFCQRKR